jgi:hypothetical protein
LKQLIPALALVAVAPLALSPLSAMAAPPAAFTATGTALLHANGKVTETRTPVKVYYQQGQMRLELKNPEYGDSVVLVQKGKSTMTLMDPKQKIAFTVTPDAMSQSENQIAMQQLTDLTGWKGLLQKQGKRLAGTQVKAGQTCSLWQTTQGKATTKVWFADALELPMQIETVVAGKPSFSLTIQSIDTRGTHGANLFKVPADFTKADLQN